MDTATKIGPDFEKPASKKVPHKNFLKPRALPGTNSRRVDEIDVVTEKRQEILNKLR